MVHQHAGRPLSFNNIADLSAGRELLREFSLPGCVIIKHQNPCGVALAGNVHEAYQKALAGDPVSAFGGVVTVNRPVTRELAEVLAEQFIELALRAGLRGRRRRRSCAAARTCASSRTASGAARTRASAACSA